MDQPVIKPKITRRMFLKTSATVAAVATAGELLSRGRAMTLISDANAQSAAKEDGWYPGVCKFCMQGDCQERVHVVDGIVVQVEGEPRALQNQGALCPRGNSAIMQMYNPWRVKAPVKRTNPKKGLNEDPGFVEITWDEALNTVSDKLKAVRQDDPRKVIVCSGFGVRNISLGWFEAAYGTPNDVPSRGSACAYHFGSALVNGNGPDNVPDIEKCDYIINIARTLGPNIATSSVGTRHMLDAVNNRGMKIVNVDPRSSPEVAKSSEWVPIRPGTEQAFLLGMLYTALYEIGNAKLDMWFIKNRTNGPYLIGPDGDYVFDKASNKPLIWDEVENRARTFDEIPPMQSALEGSYVVDGVKCSPGFQLIKDTIKPYTPEWAEEISTVSAATIRRLTQEFIDHAKIGSTVTIDGFTMPFRPVSIQFERGAYQHTIEGSFGDLVSKILCELVGCLEVPGGQTGNSTPSKAWLEPGEDGVRKPGGESAGEEFVWPPERIDSKGFYPVSHTLVHLMAKGILDPQTYHLAYEPEVMLTSGGGPIRSSFDRAVFEQAYAKIPYHVALSLTYDESAMMADIVLPDQAFLEKDQYQPGSSAPPGHKVMIDATRGQRAFYWRDASKIRPAYNAHSADQTLLDLADRIGIMTGEKGVVAQVNKSYKLEDANVLDINSTPTLRQISEAYLKQTFGNQYSLENVNDANGPVYDYVTRGAKNYNYFYWPDNTTRHPMYFNQMIRVANKLHAALAEAGLDGIPGWVDQNDYWKAFVPIPVWTPCPEFDAPAEYDLWAINWKTPMAPFYCGDTHGNVWLHETMSTFDPYEYAIWMNSATAKSKGIQDGDTIVVESRYGKTQGRVKVTELIHPEVVGIPSGHGAASIMANPIVAEGPYFNALCSIHEKDQATDPITGGIEEGPAVKVYKA
jgi:anaerobic selenocysteine-containing dehydrogenase